MVSSVIWQIISSAICELLRHLYMVQSSQREERKERRNIKDIKVFIKINIIYINLMGLSIKINFLQ